MKLKMFLICCITVLLIGCEDEHINESYIVFDDSNAQEYIKSERVEESYTEEYVYYVTPYGEKYHYFDCFYVRGKLNYCIAYTVEQAIKYGYEPCSRCIEK